MQKKLVLFLIVLVSIKSYAQSVNIYQVDPLDKVFKERAYFDSRKDTLHAAAGETVSVQLVAKANKEIKNLAIEAVNINNGAKKLYAKSGWVTYVPVGRSYIPASRDILHSVSGYFPDPIVDDTTLNLNTGEINPLWISVPIPVNTPSGIYKGKVNISGMVSKRKESFQQDFVIKVYPVKVPQTSLWISNWSNHPNTKSLEPLNRGNKVEAFSPLYWELVKVHADMMASHNQNVNRIYPLRNTGFRIKDGKYTFDFTNFDKEVEIFEKAGVLKRIEGGHIAWRSAGWDDPFFVEVILENNEENRKIQKSHLPDDRHDGMRSVILPLSDKRAQNFLDQFLPALRDHLQQKGWLHKYMQHISDEPTAKNSPSYLEISRYVKKYMPDVKIMEAVLTSKEVKDGIDLWIPVLDVYHKDYKFYQDLQKNGKEIWFYTCVGPRGNYANRFIELPLIQSRYLHWINYKYGATGFLHWGLNYWDGGNPLIDDASRDRGKLPAGDAYIVYPGYRKLYTSIRFETMRDGIYDYELLKMLEKKDPKKAKEFVDDLIKGFNEYDNSVMYFRKIRKQMLHELSS